VPSSQLPSYVDDVIEYANLAAFTEQSTGKIYVARDTGKIYRWSGSAYIEISSSPGSTDSVTEGSTNLYFTTARAAAAAPVQSVAGRTGAVTFAKSDIGLGNVDNTADTSKPVSTAQAAADAAVQAYAIQRANHTGTQAASTISDFATQAAKYGPVTSVNGQTGDVTVSGGSSYTLPTATDAVLGGVKVGSGLSINFGVLSATGPSVITEPTSANFPATGKSGNLYIATVAKTISYWTGSEYATLGGSSSGGGVTPDAPAGLTGTAGDSQISLSWTAPAIVGSSAITGYRVEYTPSGGSPTAVNTGSTSTSYTLTGLTNGTAYTVRVAGVNAVGTGTYTAAGAITPTALLFRAIPTLTSNTSNGTAEANTVSVPGGDVWNLFDNTASEYLTRRNDSDSPQRYFQYSFAGGVKSYIGGYAMTAVGDRNNSIFSWEFSGSNDGTNFTLLETRLAFQTRYSSGGQTLSFTLASPANYSTYRWTLTPDGTNESTAGLRAVQLTAVPTIPVVTISSQPSNQTASSGSATFSVTASATESATLTYQWQKSTDSGSTFLPVSGATSASLVLSSLTTGDNSSQYRVVVGASGGATSVTSSAATLTVTASYTPTAVLLTSGTSYTVPSGATSMKAWAVGGGGYGYGGGGGGTAYKTWAVTGGSSVGYVVAPAGATGGVTRQASSTVTYGGVTITGVSGRATGGGAGVTYYGTFSGGDGGANGGEGQEPGTRGASVGGNGTVAACGRRQMIDVSGLKAAVAAAGGKTVEDCTTDAAFGSGGSGKFDSQKTAGYGGGGGETSKTGGSGAVVLYFT
jgi:hypothetical protein